MRRLFFSVFLLLVVVSFVLAAGLADSDWPTSGTLSVNKLVLDPGETLMMTITGEDKDGLYDLWIQVQGPNGDSKLYQFEAQGKKALKKFRLSLSSGDYRISGSVRGYRPDGYITSVTTSPPIINVWVRPYATHRGGQR